MLSEACFIYGWTPKEALSMPIKLFFAMLKKGKEVEIRKRSRILYELCNVSRITNLTPESQTELMQFFWDQSMTQGDVAKRDNFIEQVKEIKPVEYAPPAAILDFFRGARRG